MLRLTKKSDYGIIALGFLARRQGMPVSSREISDRFSIPPHLLSNVLKTLAGEGIVESVRGAGGGYRLSVAPEELTLGALLEALEGPIRLTECMDMAEGETSECKLEANCPIRTPVKKIHDRFRDWLGQVTFAEISSDSDDFNTPQDRGKDFYAVTNLYGQPIHD